MLCPRSEWANLQSDGVMGCGLHGEEEGLVSYAKKRGRMERQF
jgi:hypothetical protein